MGRVKIVCGMDSVEDPSSVFCVFMMTLYGARQDCLPVTQVLGEAWGVGKGLYCG